MSVSKVVCEQTFVEKRLERLLLTVNGLLESHRTRKETK